MGKNGNPKRVFLRLFKRSQRLLQTTKALSTARPDPPHHCGSAR
jgi:hypothetical protein